MKNLGFIPTEFSDCVKPDCKNRNGNAIFTPGAAITHDDDDHRCNAQGSSTTSITSNATSDLQFDQGLTFSKGSSINDQIVAWSGSVSLPDPPDIAVLSAIADHQLTTRIDINHHQADQQISRIAYQPSPQNSMSDTKEGQSSPMQRQFTEKGGQYLKGRFTSQEKERLRQAIIRYVEEHQLGPNGVELLCAKERRPELRGAWSTIASCVPQRSVSSCYHFCTRAFSTRSTGRWTEKDIELLREMVARHGRKWTLIGALIKRLPCSCRDKWRLIEKKSSWSLNDDNILICHMMANSEVVSKPIGRHSQQEAMERWASKYRDLIVGDKRHYLSGNDVILLEKIIAMDPNDSLDIHWPATLPVGDWPGSFCMWRWEIICTMSKSITQQRPAKIAEWTLNNMAMQTDGSCSSDPCSPDGGNSFQFNI